jgi:hypothetical protein
MIPGTPGRRMQPNTFLLHICDNTVAPFTIIAKNGQHNTTQPKMNTTAWVVPKQSNINQFWPSSLYFGILLTTLNWTTPA